MNEQSIKYLIQQKLTGKLTSEEQDTLTLWLQDENNRELFVQLVTPLISTHHETGNYRENEFESVLKNILIADNFEQETPVRKMQFNNWYRYAAAAVVLFVIATTIYLFNNKHSEQLDLAKQLPPLKEVPAGTTKAVLTLADGSQIILDSTHQSGTLARQGNTKVINQNGQLSYDGKTSTDILYNTLTTHRGEQSPVLTLADGTKVWLNAASSIQFPVSFTGKERDVTITGEVYFEVAKNADMPFKVHIKMPSGDGGDVLVLGTHFNIMAYPEEAAVKTTLLEGAVQVSKGVISKQLVPGQQAVLRKGSDEPTVQETDVDIAVAWKNGLFMFDPTDVGALMRQISRWYNVEIRFAGGVPDKVFWGGIDRSLPLSSVLKALEKNNIRFRMEGKEIIVLP